MVTLRSGRAVPYLGKNVPKRTRAKKTKKPKSEETQKSVNSKLTESPAGELAPKQSDQQSEIPIDKMIGECCGKIEAVQEKNESVQAAIPNMEENEIESNKSTEFNTPLPIEFASDISFRGSTSLQAELLVDLNDFSSKIDQSNLSSVLDESFDYFDQTMIDDTFERTDSDFDQPSRIDVEPQPALRICLPVKMTMQELKNEPIVSRGGVRADNNNDDTIKQKPLADLCTVTDISWF